jgi:hypothetical protein
MENDIIYHNRIPSNIPLISQVNNNFENLIYFENWLIGFINTNGKFVIDFNGDFCLDFNSGMSME